MDARAHAREERPVGVEFAENGEGGAEGFEVCGQGSDGVAVEGVVTIAEVEDGEEVAADGRKWDGDFGTELGDGDTAGGGAAGFEWGVAGIGGVEFERDG